MARIIDFTRQRYGTFRRGQTEDKRRINEQLRQISQSYLRPDVVIPAATSAIGGAVDIGKGLMQRAAKSKAQASMLESAQARLAAQPRVLDKSDPAGLAREFVDPIAAARTQRQIQDIQGIQQQGLAYLQSQATMANTEERQRELLSLANLTQGPQYQGRSLAQIAAGQTLPDAGQIGTQQKLMASLFPQTQAELEAQRLKTRGAVAGVEKAEAEVQGIRSANAVKALDAAIANFRQLALKDPKLAPYVSGLEKIIAEVENIDSQIDRRADQTKIDKGELAVKQTNAETALRRLSEDTRNNERNYRLALQRLQFQQRKEARKASQGLRQKARSAYRGKIPFKIPEVSTSFLNPSDTLIGLIDQYNDPKNSIHGDSTEAKKAKFSLLTSVFRNAGITPDQFRTMPKAGDPGYNESVEGMAIALIENYNRATVQAGDILSRNFDLGQTPPALAAKGIIDEAQGAVSSLVTRVGELNQRGPTEQSDEERKEVTRITAKIARITDLLTGIQRGSYNNLGTLYTEIMDKEFFDEADTRRRSNAIGIYLKTNRN